MSTMAVTKNANHSSIHAYNFYDIATTIARNINRIAIPAIALFAIANVPGADAGPLAYAACTTLCLGFATPLFAPLCITGCLPALAAPTP